MIAPLSIYLGVGILAQTSLGSSAVYPTACSSLTVTPPEGASLINATGTERYNVTYEGTSFNGPTGSVDICDVEVFLTHGDAGDIVRFSIYLPLKGWNGRWQAAGGGGFAASSGAPLLLPPVIDGYAAGETDAGVGIDGNVDWWYNSTQLVDNFVYLSFHELTILGKDLSEKFYGRKPDYSYWFGCSTGGRQGMSEAQRYPEDYDGIFAAAPAVNWARAILADYWPLTVQNQGGEPVPLCKLQAMGNASIEACDSLDGAVDGLIGNPLKCEFNAESVIGLEVQCDGNTTTTITERDATVWNRIREGFKDEEGNFLWYGLEPGTNLLNQAIQPGFLPPKQWISAFLLQSPGLNVDDVKQDQLVDLFHQSVSEFNDLWGTDNPDLSAFHARGGKILTLHGWADDLIAPGGTLDYWRRVVDLAGGEQEADEFYRVFMVPGLGHCFGGPGPQIGMNSLAPLNEWVEKGNAPETVFMAGNGQTRNVCKFPKELEYSGSGNVSDAASWKCV